MITYSTFLFLLLIQRSYFVPINQDCGRLNQGSLFLEQALMSESPANGGPCDAHSCQGTSVIELMNSPSICEQQLGYRIQLQHIGMEHLKSALSILYRSILIGGYWTISIIFEIQLLIMNVI